MLVERVQVAYSVKIAAGVRTRERDLRRAIQGRTSTNHDRTDRLAFHPPGHIDRRRPSKEKGRARESETNRVQERRRKNVLLLDAVNLLAQGYGHQAERVCRRRIRIAVVDGVDAVERVLA